MRDGTDYSRAQSRLALAFQSTRPLRDGTKMDFCGWLDDAISIHPPLAGRDKYGKQAIVDAVTFQSTRPLRDGTSRTGKLQFQSTRPLRDGTYGVQMSAPGFPFQSTRPLRDGTRLDFSNSEHHGIAIHPPLAGRDPLGGYIVFTTDISIHPPLAGRDQTGPTAPQGKRYFNPPAPCGTGRSHQSEH